MDTDLLTRVYNDKLKALAGRAENICRLDNPDISVTKNSMICGSSVTVDLCVCGQSKITSVGFATESCALTKSVLAVMDQALLGKSRQEVKDIYQAVVNMLENGGDVPAGDWSGLEVLAPVRDYPARHDTVYLPFLAVDQAFEGLTTEQAS